MSSVIHSLSKHSVALLCLLASFLQASASCEADRPPNAIRRVFVVMDFVEHDLKTLLATMPTPFLVSEIKTLLLQLLSAIALCHDNWIVHRDLKTSNLLMNNRGQIKVADFGLARTYGDPLGDMTQLVVTLWYR